MDSRRLGHLESFASFIEFLTNPQEYRDLIVELQQAMAEWRALNEKARGIKDVDAFRDQVTLKLAEREKALASAEEARKKAAAAERAEFDKLAESNAKERAKLDQDHEAIKAQLAKVEVAAKERAELTKQEQRLNEKEARLHVMDKDLKEKAAKLKQIMGDA